MKRISREAAWGILSNHKIVILGHGEASVEEHKKIIEGTLKIMPDIVKDMIKDKRIYVTECDEKQITWNDENTLQYDHLLDAFIEDGYLYFREYEKKYAITTAVYVIGLREVPDTCEYVIYFYWLSTPFGNTPIFSHRESGRCIPAFYLLFQNDCKIFLI